MSDRENSKNCNCKDQPQEPETTCDVVLAAERQKCEEEKKGLFYSADDENVSMIFLNIHVLVFAFSFFFNVNKQIIITSYVLLQKLNC